ncbi:hypothetical protein C9374_005476 [Naegleria lovaniensis]|uniref:Vps72/YL1 C-terminal domain-containing protein n=1 Tax=Naegleria lovaniensis TaxID=51637 RepID=A0AA88GJS6_NAELO|nr:uncharacterized protein C9374_005476 [Naegleria lovaniensis]KAG2382274.1 hypothetical protein C9374_005476 [Naegleria lovaniensis]
MSEEEPTRKVLPQRSTRGKRVSDLEGIDKQVDDEFWKMEMFAEEAEDQGFEATDELMEEQADIEDSDIDEFSSDEEEEERAKQLEKKLAKEERESKKRKNVYKDTASKKPKSSTPKTPRSKPVVAPSTIESKRSARASTKKATEASEEKLKQTQQKTPKKTPKKVYAMPSQEELLEEAKITAEYNKNSLAKLVQIEEDIRKKARETKTKTVDPDEPRVVFYSKEGKQYITFVNMEIPKEINQKNMSDTEIARFDIPKEEKQLKCVVTGLPAKYIDPVTKKPFANVEAFRAIRKNKKL